MTLSLKDLYMYAAAAINCGTSSVLSAATLRKKNPDVKKYLQDKTSVNNVEWLCKTCLNYLAKNKVPPCAAINGMQWDF